MTTREAALHELDALEDAGWDTPPRRERLLRRAGMWEVPRDEPASIPAFEPEPDTGERFAIWYMQYGEWTEHCLRYRDKAKAEHTQQLLIEPKFGRSLILRITLDMTQEQIAAALSDLIATPQKQMEALVRQD